MQGGGVCVCGRRSVRRSEVIRVTHALGTPPLGVYGGGNTKRSTAVTPTFKNVFTSFPNVCSKFLMKKRVKLASWGSAAETHAPLARHCARARPPARRVASFCGSDAAPCSHVSPISSVMTGRKGAAPSRKGRKSSNVPALMVAPGNTLPMAAQSATTCIIKGGTVRVNPCVGVARSAEYQMGTAEWQVCRVPNGDRGVAGLTSTKWGPRSGRSAEYHMGTAEWQV